MERESKFRGRKKDGKWLYGYIGEYTYSCLGKQYTNTVIFNNIADFCTDNVAFVVLDCSVDESTVGKFTGMLDKNKKEIYEGDIVKAPLLDPIFCDIIKDRFINASIEFNNGSFVVSYYGGEHKIYLQDLHDKIEVIGNIHDNIELLNK